MSYILAVAAIADSAPAPSPVVKAVTCLSTSSSTDASTRPALISPPASPSGISAGLMAMCMAGSLGSWASLCLCRQTAALSEGKDTLKMGDTSSASACIRIALVLSCTSRNRTLDKFA